MSLGVGIGKWTMGFAGVAVAALTAAQTLLANETNGLAFVSNDTTTSDYGSLCIKDTVTPANAYSGAPFTFAGGKLTHSRTSLAMEQDAAGLWKYANHNLLVRSQEFDNGSWAGAIGTANTTTAPDGTLTADTLTDANAGAISTAAQTVTFVAGAYKLFIRAKANTSSVFYIQVLDGTSYFPCYYDLSGAGSTTIRTGFGTPTVAISALSDGWYLCEMAFTAAAGTGEISLVPAARNDMAGGAGSNAITGSLYVWGADLKAQPCISTTYVPTTTAAVHLPKRYRDPSTLTNYGYWPEEARTNLLTYSNNLSNAIWTKETTTVAQNANGPLGTSTAWAVSEAGATSAPYSVYQGTSLASAIRTSSAFLKQAGRRYVNYITQAGCGAQFDLQTGVVVAASNCSATIEPAAEGFYRCTVTTTIAQFNDYQVISSSTGASLASALAGDSYGRENVTGLNGVAFYVTGAQLEAGSFATSPIPTTSASVTRAADTCSIATSLFNHSATAWTMFVEHFLLSETPFLASLDDGTGAETNTFFYGDLSEPKTHVWDNSVLQANIDSLVSGSATLNAAHKIAGAFAANDFALAFDGNAAVTDVSGSMPTVTTLRMGTNIFTVGGGIGLSKVMHLPRRMSNAELQTVTT